MRRQPKPREPKLIHVTTNSGDVQEFVLSDDNFDPKAIGKAGEMLDWSHPEVAGFTLHYWPERTDEPARFEVHARNSRLTINFVREEGRDILLETSLVWPGAEKHCDLLAKATDLERFAAIALVLSCRERRRQWKEEWRTRVSELGRKGQKKPVS